MWMITKIIALSENVLLILEEEEEENGQTAFYLREGLNNSENHSLQQRYAEEHP